MRLTKARRLRQVLSDGRWHTNTDLVRAGCGYRYGANILVLRRGRDGGPPLIIEVERVREGLYRYRCTGTGEAPAPRPRRTIQRERAADLAREAVRAALERAQLRQEEVERLAASAGSAIDTALGVG